METLAAIETAESENGDTQYDDEDFEESGSKFSESEEDHDETQKLKSNLNFSEYDDDGFENSTVEKEDPINQIRLAAPISVMFPVKDRVLITQRLPVIDSELVNTLILILK
jgi:hypothetical protein